MEEKTNAIKPQLSYEPMRQNRFFVELEGLDIEPWRIQKVIFNEEKIVLQVLEVVDFKDTIDVVSENHHKKFNMKIHLLDPTGVTVRTYKYERCLVKKIIPCPLDMESDELITTDLEIIFDIIR